MNISDVSLVVFTCKGREQLLHQTLNSFRQFCKYPFHKIILAIDGTIDPAVIAYVNPDLVVQSPVRKGYVNSILHALKNIDTEYFFWLEDDWNFNAAVDIELIINNLQTNRSWVQVAYSKHAVSVFRNSLTPLTENFYNNPNGFSANPMICRTALIKDCFNNLLLWLKDGAAGNEGFENFVSRDLERQGLLCVVYELPDKTIISHEGYLESTARNWHMINSIEVSHPEEYLLTMPEPPFWRRVLMAWRLFIAFLKLAIKQLANNEAYELCFRILASIKNTGKNG